MKILVIESNHAVSDQVVNDERMVNFRRLMEFGCYGRMGMRSQGNMWRTRLWEKLQAAGLNLAVLGGPCFEKPEDFTGVWEECLPENDSSKHQGSPHLTHRFESARRMMQSMDWQTFYLVGWQRSGGWPLTYLPLEQSSGAYADTFIHIDRGLESLLEVLEEETAVLLLFYSGPRENGGQAAGSFILAVPNCSMEGEVIGATLEDLLVTMIELGEGQLTPDMKGRSLYSNKLEIKTPGTDLSLDEEAILRERLSGLGYLG